MKFENFPNPFEVTVESAKRLARSKIVGALLFVAATPSLEACAGGVALGTGPLSAVQKGERPDNPDMPDYEKMLSELKQVFGDDVVSAALRKQRKFAEKDWSSNKTGNKGFEILDIKSDRVASQLSHYPRGWLTHVSRVSVDPHFVPISYPGLEGKPEAAHCTSNFNGDPVTVELTSKIFTRSDDPGLGPVDYVFLKVLPHEFAHANDWEASPRLNAKQSLELLYNVYVLSTDPGRPKFIYPESIKPKDPKDSKDAAYSRATEYFAELVTAGFSVENANDWTTWENELANGLARSYAENGSPEAVKKNVIFLRRFLNLIDSGFKPWEFAQKTSALDEKINLDIWDARLTRNLEKIPDNELREALMSVLRMKTSSRESAYYQYYRVKGLDVTRNSRFAKTGSYLDSLENGFVSSNREVFSPFSNVLEAALSVRLNKDGIQQEAGYPFSMSLGNATVSEFVERYESLSVQNKVKLKAALLAYAQEATKDAPPKDTRTAEAK